MTDKLLLIASSVALLVGIALYVTARVMARNRARYLASRQTHPAE